MSDFSTLVPVSDAGERDERDFYLVIMAPDRLTTQPLPKSGSITFGRGRESDVTLDDPLVSRQHARLHLGATLEVEDLGSANGSQVRETRLAPGVRVSIQPGEPVTLGTTVIMVQRKPGAWRRPQILPHAYFEARLDEECARHSERAGSFAVIRIRTAADPVSPLTAALTELFRQDVLAAYGPGEYEVLKLGDRPGAGALATEVEQALAEHDPEVRVGVALFPADGRTPDTLLDAAGARARRATTVELPRHIVLEDAAMCRLYELAIRAAVGNLSILILGETGTGKEVLAETIHRKSRRRDSPFLCLNCAALSENLLESELFGYEKGAFTGAQQTKPGLLESAPGGTIFLDEAGEMSLSTQARLLRVLETREVLRVGGVKPRPIDVRILSATNRDLAEDVAQGKFRRDLYFRLNGLTLFIPPLRERRREIPVLARRFVAGSAHELGRRPEPKVTEAAMQMLESYAWPGNIRELKNVMDRAVLLSASGDIEPEHLGLERVLRPSPAPPASGAREVDDPPTLTWEQKKLLERRRILEALDACNGNQSRAAEKLGISRRTLLNRLDEFAIDRPRKGRDGPK
jgi:two-component system, NtrC family, response regulator AtoC